MTRFGIRPTLLEVRIFTHHHFHRRSFSTNRDFIPVHSGHDMFTIDGTCPNGCERDPSRQLDVAECRFKLLLTI